MVLALTGTMVFVMFNVVETRQQDFGEGLQRTP
jgi:hypothetical protein